MNNEATPRAEHPRPQFERNEWLNLNGTWEFEFDDRDEGERQRWYSDEGVSFSKSIVVPFCFESKLSGIGDSSVHDVVWYRRTLDIPSTFADKRAILHFGAVDYNAKVWVNGQLVATHEGGHTPFHADITDALNGAAGNQIVVRAQDYSRDMALPRGKQYWKDKSEGIFYTRTTGIWQTVWLEAVSDVHLQKVKFTPDIDKNSIHVQYYLSKLFLNGSIGTDTYTVKTTITFEGQFVSEDVCTLREEISSRSITLETNIFRQSRLWSPAKPQLYGVNFTLERNGQPIDVVNSYFGMRKISIEDGKLYLNNRPYYMKLVLDQGYFPESLLTPPSDEAIKFDVEATKAMGFNGARKHQKIEDPRYLYWCDKLGLLVWGEMANAYTYTEAYAAKITKEWLEAVDRDYNHPCLVAWVPLNESWGVLNISHDEKQQRHAQALYYLTKSLDTTRPVISNDGWEHATSDLCTIHDYAWKKEVLEDRYSTAEKAVSAHPGSHRIYAPGFQYEGQPILVTEFGGIAFNNAAEGGWGYSGAKDEADFVKRLADVVHPLLNSPVVQGFCYTQLTDVEQEMNGLMSYDRKPKLPFDVIKKINEGKTPALTQ